MGCEWKDELNDINGHLGNNDGCRFEVVDCPNECGKMIQQQRLTSHVEVSCKRREVNCQYCHRPGEYQIVMGQHKSQCPKFPLLYPNKCEVGTIPHEYMKKHRAKCLLEIITCSNHVERTLKGNFWWITFTPNAHVIRSTASTAMIQESTDLLRANTRRSVPSSPYPVPTSVRLGVFLVKI